MSTPDTDSSSIPDEESSLGVSESGGFKQSKNPLYYRVRSSPSESSGKDSYKSRSAGVCRLVSASIHTVAIIILVATPILMYLLYSQVDELSSKVTSLEKLSTSSVEPAKQQQQEDVKKLQALLDALPKDALAHMLDKDHILDEHHGIGSQHIAHIYGTKEELESCYKSAHCSEKEFKSMKSNSICTNGQSTSIDPRNSTLKARYNENRDVWCIFGLKDENATGRKDRFLISGKAAGHSRGIYQYFKPASWLSEENFATPKGYAIRVLNDGMYMVFATVHFLSRDTSMTVIKEDVNDKESTIGACLVNIDVRFNATELSEETEFSCSVTQIVTLKAHDKLHMRFTTEKMFWVQEDLLYMTVIKLNGYASH